ncbi:glycosyltransferase family 4 protein [Adhaeretor mobilis]|uniref:GDP-mannose-dependent alpha-(1-6)-phosphatidylinositol monomannoside mannosyltransferase n=1 Tax=Adhaeretor mobilis TaxID=1930276 RepID=A0A517MRM1_9BACT|nr:glycosyltransferase family 4 protein [Adhaeretor mobilis]QDS97526.1 GDP-mannose-dependent alpha-(1-6)-phosphatidylinositol monomannoside mannosyltransferase [Adhaeretor mobilis]
MTMQTNIDDSTAGEEEARISTRVVMQQPSLAKYRVPVFRELAGRDGIDFELLYGDLDGIPNVAAEGFRSELVPLGQYRVLGTELLWHTAQGSAVSRKRADVAILVWNVRYLSLVPALLKAKFSGVKTILWGHAYSKQESPVRKFIRQRVAQLADALLFYNQQAATQFRSEGWPEERMFVALNSLDQAPIIKAKAHWAAQPEQLEEFRLQHGLAEGPVLLYVSRFDPANRADLLIAATAQLQKEFPSLRVVLIGKENEERRRLEELVRQAGLEQHVQFPGAIYDEQLVAPWFLSADAFCYPANIGLSLLHAMGYGLPVVTGDDIASHNPEIEALQDGVNGLLFQHGSVDSLTDSLSRIFSEPELRHSMSINAEKTIAEKFNLETMVDGMAAAVRYCRSLAD